MGQDDLFPAAHAMWLSLETIVALFLVLKWLLWEPDNASESMVFFTGSSFGLQGLHMCISFMMSPGNATHLVNTPYFLLYHIVATVSFGFLGLKLAHRHTDLLLGAVPSIVLGAIHGAHCSYVFIDVFFL